MSAKIPDALRPYAAGYVYPCHDCKRRRVAFRLPPTKKHRCASCALRLIYPDPNTIGDLLLAFYAADAYVDYVLVEPNVPPVSDDEIDTDEA